MNQLRICGILVIRPAGKLAERVEQTKIVLAQRMRCPIGLDHRVGIRIDNGDVWRLGNLRRARGQRKQEHEEKQVLHRSMVLEGILIDSLLSVACSSSRESASESGPVMDS